MIYIPRKFSENGMKVCPGCKLEKGRDDYYLESVSGKPFSFCKQCAHEQRKKHIAKDPKKFSTYGNEYHEKHREHINGLQRKIAHRNKLIVINHYGGKCVCCGENRIEFMALDHKNGGGNKMRKAGAHPKTGKGLYAWIIRNNFPDYFQLLCFNCNQAKGSYGVCPHEKERKNEK